jgi:hypothetical protein
LFSNIDLFVLVFHRDSRLSPFDKLLLSDPWLAHIAELNNMPELYKGQDIVGRFDWNSIKVRLMMTNKEKE